MMVWDVRRRELLGAGAVGAATAGFVGFSSAAASERWRAITLVEESGTPESVQFASAMTAGGRTARIIRVDRSLNGLLVELEESTGLVVGLTSDPAAMIAGQLLVERGARERLWWQHHYGEGRWRHRTGGARRLLESSTRAWPVAIAHEVRNAVDGKSRPASNTCVSGSCALAASSPGMLVSWAYEIEGTES